MALAAERAKYGLPAEFKVTREMKKTFSPQEKTMYKTAYEIGGAKRANEVPTFAITLLHGTPPVEPLLSHYPLQGAERLLRYVGLFLRLVYIAQTNSIPYGARRVTGGSGRLGFCLSKDPRDDQPITTAMGACTMPGVARPFLRVGYRLYQCSKWRVFNLFLVADEQVGAPASPPWKFSQAKVSSQARPVSQLSVK